MRSTEAGLKYFVLGALSSGMLLYGASLIYGFTGTVIVRRHRARRRGHGGIGLIFGLVFLFAGFCFKVSAVPFHMWTPDVYEGAPTPVTAFFAAAPKIAAHGDVRARRRSSAFPGITPQWQQIVVFVSIASMVLGAFAAIGQRNIKRLMAYSSIGHMGFALIGLAAGTAGGRAGRARLHGDLSRHDARHLRRDPRRCGAAAAWSRTSTISRASRAPIRRWRSSWRCCCSRLPAFRRSPASSRSIYVFLAAIKAGLYVLAVIGVLASVVGAYYYLPIVKVMYFDEPAGSFEPMPGALKVVLGVSGAVHLLFFVYPAPLVRRRERPRSPCSDAACIPTRTRPASG